MVVANDAPANTKLLPEAMVVTPLSDTAPVPVPNVFAPDTVVGPVMVMPPVDPLLINTDDAAADDDPIFTVDVPVVCVAICTVIVPPVVAVSAIPTVSLFVPVACPIAMMFGEPATQPVVAPINGHDADVRIVLVCVHDIAPAALDVSKPAPGLGPAVGSVYDPALVAAGVNTTVPEVPPVNVRLFPAERLVAPLRVRPPVPEERITDEEPTEFPI